MQAITLSVEAIALLKLHVERKGETDVDDTNRDVYRELARAGLMTPLHSFTRGREALYRITDEGWDRRLEFISPLLPQVVGRRSTGGECR